MDRQQWYLGKAVVFQTDIGLYRGGKITAFHGSYADIECPDGLRVSMHIGDVYLAVNLVERMRDASDAAGLLKEFGFPRET